MLQVSEIHRTLQGEGNHAGLPCVMVRLAGCNLRCAWCDTDYAQAGGTLLSIDEVLARVRRFATPLVEITGGEPLLQPDTIALMERLLAEGHEVLVETNGSLDIGPVPPGAVRIVDVKCPGSGESGRNFLANLEGLRPSDELKFVLADRLDYEWATRLVAERRILGRAQVIFTPADGRLEPGRLAEWILAEGPAVRLGIQLHKILWPEGEPR